MIHETHEMFETYEVTIRLSKLELERLEERSLKDYILPDGLDKNGAAWWIAKMKEEETMLSNLSALYSQQKKKLEGKPRDEKKEKKYRYLVDRLKDIESYHVEILRSREIAECIINGSSLAAQCAAPLEPTSVFFPNISWDITHGYHLELDQSLGLDGTSMWPNSDEGDIADIIGLDQPSPWAC